MSEIKLAVLIDAENISPRYVQIIFDEVSNYGVSTYRRIYGDWTSTGNTRWKGVLLDNSITPIQQYSYTDGKNASDSAMIIDAMDILYTESVNGFVLVSSDSDFTRLASRLRESGMSVIGMGESKTPKAFISACNSFKYLDILYDSQENDFKAGAAAPAVKEKAAPEPAPTGSIRQENSPGKSPKKPVSRRRQDRTETPQPQTSLKSLGRALRNIVSENSDDENWMSLANLGNQLSKRFPDFDVRNYGHKKLVTLVESFKDFEVERRKTSEFSGKQLFVRLIEDRK